jgi:hypothetical protein
MCKGVKRKMETLPQELVEKILLHTDLTTAIATGNKYYINKMYNKNSWAWAAENNQLNTIIWLHFNKRNDFDPSAAYISNDKQHKKINKFINNHYDYFGKSVTISIPRNGDYLYDRFI